MLVLSRKVGQRIHIGGGIELAVLSVHNGRVRLGLAAPRAVTIRRREIDLPSRAEEDEAAERVEPGDP
jgi:carbon storage regulator